MSEWKKAGGDGVLDKAEEWSWEDNPILLGFFRRKKTILNKQGQNVELYFFDVKGTEYKVWGSTVLDRKMVEVPENSEVKIEYLGKEKGEKGFEYRSYNVEYREPEKESEKVEEQIPF
jgi:hypothetical protein